MSEIETNITGGTVSIEDGVKAKEDFAPARKVKVELTFSVPESQDGTKFLDGVTLHAENKVRQLLNKSAAEPIQAAVSAEGAKAPAGKTSRAKAPVVPEKTKDDLAREAGLPADGTTQHKGADLVDELEEATKAPAKAKPADDDLSDILGETAAPKPVTDQELGKAAQEKNGDMKGKAGWAPEKIRELVGQFVLTDGKPKPGAKLQEIPAAQRHEFLAQLKALK